jgi:hypothetical protein
VDDHKKIWDALGVEPGGFFVTGVDIQRWGNRVVIACVYTPWETPDKTFQLVFTDCTAIRWETYGDEIDLIEPDADVIGVHLEENKPAVIHTLVFEVTITYGSMTILKNW